ncbi:AAA family ATPase [bacterium]|nr:AAA family ATPase [bacterium]
MNRKLLAVYGLKYNPFSQEVPTEALAEMPHIEHFSWRVENLAREGGFALATGAAGHGKSSAMRILQARLSALVDLRVGVLSRPQSGVADFYRELGELFGVSLSPHNRWAGAKVLRQRWQAHIEQSLFRPVLLVDEAQEMITATLTELRLLCSDRLDSRMLLTVVLGGDGRLTERFRTEELLSLGSRMRVRLNLEPLTPTQLHEVLLHRLTAAGSPKLMTGGLEQTLCEHAAGNLRVLMTMADQLLAEGLKREVAQLDEKLYLEVFSVPGSTPSKAKRGKARRRR